MTGLATGRTATATGPAAAPWSVLGLALAGSLLVVLDSSALVIALPSLESALSASATTAQLVVVVYQIAFGASVIVGGRLGDVLGRRRVFAAGTAAFAVASLLGAAAPGLWPLVAARSVQGLAAAAIMPQALAYLRLLFPAEQRPRALGVMGAVQGAAGIAGPAYGGLLISMGGPLSWRVVLTVDGLLALVLLVLAFRMLPEQAHQPDAAVDTVGAVLAAAACFLVIVPLLLGGGANDAARLAMVLLGVAVVAALAWFEHRRRRAGQWVLLDGRLLRSGRFAAGIGAGVLLFAGVGAFGVVLTVYLQNGLGLSPAHAALIAMASPVGSMCSSLASSRIMDRVGRWTIPAGAAVTLGGMAAMVAAVTAAAPYPAWLVPGIMLSGVGIGLVLPPYTGLLLRGVDPQMAGGASGVISTAQQMSRAIGVAALGLMFVLSADVSAGIRAAQAQWDIAGAGSTLAAGSVARFATAAAAGDFARSGEPAPVPAELRPTARRAAAMGNRAALVPAYRCSLGWLTVAFAIAFAALTTLTWWPDRRKGDGSKV